MGQKPHTKKRDEVMQRSLENDCKDLPRVFTPGKSVVKGRHG